MAVEKKPSRKKVAAGKPKPGAERDTQAAAINATAAAFAYNRNKAAEYGRDGALNPPAGAHEAMQLPSAGASTLSETNLSAKTGAAALAERISGVVSLGDSRVDASGQRLTTNQGVPIADNQHSLKAGLRGPALLKDFILREKITHFDHERIPERIVHARGSAAHGIFESYEALDAITCASPFAQAGKQTPVFVRFSTVAGEPGSKDTARDARGFAVKFYSDTGNWDLVGNNIPVFFIQDAMKFPDLVHALKPEPQHGMPQAASAHDTFWDFVTLMPESTHMLLWVMSDRGIPRSYRMMQGFGVHTFRFVNADGESVFVKFHWTPMLGTHSLVWDEAVKISGADPDFHRRDLWEAIESGEYPQWELGVQVFTEEQAAGFSFDVLDATKLIPEELVPVRAIGRMTLNRNPDNFFAETEQVAFCTAHVIPGIDFSNDPLLAGRIHSYADTQLSRLGGPNFHEIPINAPIAPVHNNQRDGIHRQAIHRGAVAYEPNSLGGGCPFQAGAAGFVSFPELVKADELRGNPELFAEHYHQATLFFDSQSAPEQAHIIAGFRFELSMLKVPAIRERAVSMLRNVSAALAEGVAAGLGMDLPPAMPRALAAPPKPEISLSPALSLLHRPGEGGIRSRVVAILLVEGIKADEVALAEAALHAAGAVCKLIGAHIGQVAASKGDSLTAEASFENSPGFLFDGVIVPGGTVESSAVLAGNNLARAFVNEQFAHCKTMLVGGGSTALLLAAGIAVDGEAEGMLIRESVSAESIDDFIDALAKHRHFSREQ